MTSFAPFTYTVRVTNTGVLPDDFLVALDGSRGDNEQLPPVLAERLAVHVDLRDVRSGTSPGLRARSLGDRNSLRE